MKWLGLKYQNFDFSTKYIVSEIGEIQNVTTGVTLKQSTNRNGYKFVCISCPELPKRRKTIIVHKAVAYNFLPRPDSADCVVDHIDGNKSNNDYRNLEWVTCRENTIRACRLGLLVPPPPNVVSKLTDEQVLEIIQLLQDKDLVLTHKNIADKYGVCRSTISQIASGKIHKSVWTFSSVGRTQSS